MDIEAYARYAPKYSASDRFEVIRTINRGVCIDLNDRDSLVEENFYQLRKVNGEFACVLSAEKDVNFYNGCFWTLRRILQHIGQRVTKAEGEASAARPFLLFCAQLDYRRLASNTSNIISFAPSRLFNPRRLALRPMSDSARKLLGNVTVSSLSHHAENRSGSMCLRRRFWPICTSS
jgi:hypothetical protein